MKKRLSCVILLCALFVFTTSPLFGAAEKDIFEPNNTMATATTLGFPSEVNATITQGDVDFYTFMLPANATLELRIHSDNEKNNFALSLYNYAGSAITKTTAKAAPTITYKATAGRYFVMVEGAANVVGSYTFTATQIGNTSLDLSENNLLLNSLHPDAKYHIDTNLNNGGHFLMSTAYMARWNGPVLENDDPYAPVYFANGEPNINKMLPLTKTTQYHLQNAIYLPARTSYTDNENIKNAVYSYGGVDCLFISSPICYKDNYTNYYLPDNENALKHEDTKKNSGYHAVVIVGWDDTIPKENFTVSIGGVDYTPSQDGGFIVKNSWGTEIGEKGFFYVSYDCYFFAFGNNPTVYTGFEGTTNYDTIYDYSPIGYTGDNEIQGNKGKTKDIYTATADGTIEAVSYYLSDHNMEYNILIGIGSKEPTAVAQGSHQYSGYYTQNLSLPMEIKKGETFTVIIEYTNGNSDITYVPTEINNESGTSMTRAEENQSYLYKDNQWVDIGKENGANNCVKVFVNDASVKALAQNNTYIEGVKDQGHLSPVLSEEQMETAGLRYVESKENASVYGVKTIESSAQNDAGDAPIDTLPEKFDLRDLGVVSPAKDQGKIGSCWTFAAMGSTETVLARNNNSGFTYPTTISVAESNVTVDLDEKNQTAEVALTATVTPKDIGTDLVYWTYTGDLNSIDILTTKSTSGKTTPLFTAKDNGVITATATSAADIEKKAVVTITIKKWQSPFVDVTTTDWFYDAVKYANTAKLFNGTSDNAFTPQGTMTRGMMAVTLYRLAGEPSVTGSMPFQDVTEKDYYYNAVLWAYQTKIAFGTDSTKFSPNQQVERQQVAAFFHRYAALTKGDTTVNGDLSIFADKADIADYALTSMTWAVGHKIINGTPEKRINPKASATRAEVATMYLNYYLNMK